MSPQSVPRIHIVGASGSGTSTLGRALAEARGCPFYDTDDVFWKVKYTDIHPFDDRRRLLLDLVEGQGAWVLSGSLMEWGDPLIPQFDLVVFLYLPPEVRLARLAARERHRYGDDILPGGSRRSAYVDFLDWARRYDTGGPEVRSLARHREWLAQVPCPVLALEGVLEVDEKLARIAEFEGGTR